MRYGEEEKVVEAPVSGLRKQAPTPKFIKEKPSLDIGLLWYWNSFLSLSTERLRDYGEIPHSAIRRYCKDYDIPIEDIESFINMVKEMDTVYLSEQQKKVNRKGK